MGRGAQQDDADVEEFSRQHVVHVAHGHCLEGLFHDWSLASTSGSHLSIAAHRLRITSMILASLSIAAPLCHASGVACAIASRSASEIARAACLKRSSDGTFLPSCRAKTC